MESKSDRTEDENKWEQQSADERAAEQTPASSATTSPRRGLRARKAGRPKSGAPAPVDINGSHAPIPRTSGRVLRDRSTRAVPAWLKDTKSDDEDEASPLPCATKRRKVSYSRRKKPTEAAGSSEHAGEDGGVDGLSTKDSGDVEKPTSMAQGPSSTSPPGPQSRGRAPRAARGTARPVCKSEPGTEDAAAMERQVKVKERNSSASKKKKKEEEEEETGEDVYDEDLPGEKGLPFEDDPCDLNYQPQAQSEEEEALSSDEDLPFRDDLNDQSYNPKTERDAPKRRPAPRQERREKGTARDSEGEAAEIKVEGAENPDPVEEESKPEEKPREDPDGPRKRGRRRKDDKTPRLPKRRKKPPVQYVRCEMEGCGTVLAHPRYLQHHIKYQHLLKKKYVCPHPTCGRLFRLQKQLLRHAKHHTDQRDYICEFCARAFKSSHNLAVHRMIHTGEKPLQCEICGFTCRQKASLNWHMKKHDADATYQFSCSICGKKFEKKDCVVAHKAKSHPEVLIAEALAANAGALLTTPASLLELQGGQVQTEVTALEVAQATGQHVSPQVSQASQQVSQVSQQVGHQVVLLGQDQSIHTMQVPVTIALSPVDPPSPDSRQQAHQLQLQVPLHFVQAAPHSHSQQQQQQQPQIQQLTLHSGSMVTQPQIQQLTLHSGSMVTQHQGQQHHQQGQTEVLHMTFQPVSQAQTHIQQIPILASSQQLHTLQTASSSSPLLSTSQAQHTTVANGDGYVLDTSVLASSSSSANGLHQQAEAVEDGDVVWEQAGGSLIDGSEVQQVII